LTGTATVSSSVRRAEARETSLRVTARLVARLGGLVVWTLVGWVLWALGAAILLPSRRGAMRWRYVMLGAWARGVSRIIGMRIHVHGPVPRPPFLLVSNHLSYVDVVLLATQVRCAFVAKREVRGWPGIGALARAMGTVFVDRERNRDTIRAKDALARRIRDGEGIVLFAEATSSPGMDVLPFRSGLLEVAAAQQLPVHYASLWYRTPAGSAPAHLAVCWWGDMTFGDHLVSLCRLPWLEARLELGPVPVRDSDRKRLAVKLEDAVRSQFRPVVTRESSCA